MLTSLSGPLNLFVAYIGQLRVLVLAWTIADFAGRDVPGHDELAIALAMRRGEQPGAVKPQAV